MLVEISVGNYRSFKDVVTFSMAAANISLKKIEPLTANNVFAPRKNLPLLKSAAIYGANASGKSNLIKAVGFMKRLIKSFSQTQSTDSLPVEPFLLNSETEYAPSFFEIVFFLNDKIYRYGFEVTSERVVGEWLFHKNVRETNLFTRDYDHFEIAEGFKQTRGLEGRTRANALFLSVADQFNVNIARQIIGWFDKFRIISGIHDLGEYKDFTTSRIAEKQALGREIINFIKRLDLNLVDVFVEPIDFNEIPAQLRELLSSYDVVSSSNVKTTHDKYDEYDRKIGTVDFDMDTHESDGTQKVFALSGPILHALQHGVVLFVDELDTRLHPLLTQQIIQLFNSNETNPNNAQLIFITHDTNLLSMRSFRRDQIWFVEKDYYGASDLYSLVEYKGISNQTVFEEDYIMGKYGAIPYLGNVRELVEEVVDGQKAKA